MKKLFFQNMFMFTLLAALLLLSNGCATGRNGSIDNLVSERPQVHHASTVHYTGGRPVIFANTGKVTNKRNMTLTFYVRERGAPRREILHKITLSPNESLQLWLMEGAYVVDVCYEATGKRTGGKEIMVPYSGRPFRFYTRRYAAGVVF